MKWTALMFLFSFALAAHSKPFLEEAKADAEEIAVSQNALASAETAAARFVTALIDKDETQIRSASLRPYGPPSLRKKYEARLKKFVGAVERYAAQTPPPPGAPKRIEKVFAARPLSAGGPASYGYAVFNFMDIAFVDVDVQRNDGQQMPYRVLVIRDSDGQWYAHPFPDLSPLLSTGLDYEAPSTAESSGFKMPAN